MAVAALITWLLTAAGGFFMLGTWIAKGGMRAPRTTKLPPPVILGHFALAAAGLVIWIIYLFAKTTGLAWTAFVLLVPVAALGFVMLLRWIPTYRTRSAPVTVGGGADTQAATTQTLPEKHFPVPVVGGHGLFAVATVVLVLLTALGVGT